MTRAHRLDRNRRTRPRRLSRRHLVAAATGVGGGALISLGLRQPGRPMGFAAVARHDEHEHGSATPAAISWETNVPSDLREPETRRAVAGLLETELRVAHAYRDIGGYRLFLRSYEGAAPGPTLRLRPGDTIKIRLTNDLPPNRDVAPLDTDQMYQINSTNFHFHGAHVSPGGIADNVLRVMEPGQSYEIEIELPADRRMIRGTPPPPGRWTPLSSTAIPSTCNCRGHSRHRPWNRFKTRS